MNSNDVIILDKFLDTDRTSKYPGVGASAHFELFSADQILKDYDLNTDELKSGIVGASDDGGIDAIYIFLNRDLVQEDTDFETYKRGVAIELFFIQAKTSEAFSESAIDKLHAATDDLLDLSKDLSKLTKVYNKNVLASASLFRQAYEALVTRLPKLAIRYFYASKGDAPHPKVTRKAEILKQKVHEHLSDAVVEFHFLGAKELLGLARRQPSTSYKLKIAEAPITSKGFAFVSIATIDSYFDFITDEKGDLRRNIFEANVRDYQGANEVNEAIAETLRENATAEDFWWLNNGVTILCSKATHSGKVLTIENPEIVNGLQTSRELYNYFESRNIESDPRHVLVRVIVPSSPESRDRIIKATNSQTTIPTASLRSTEKIHRDIEDYFRSRGFFYDRRKNYYRNEGKPTDKIISIPYLAQAVMAIALQRPDSARARPSSLLKKDDEYRKVFSDKYPIQVYEKCAVVMKCVDTFVKNPVSQLEREHQTNLKYYLALDAVVSALGRQRPGVQQIAEMDVGKLDDSLLSTSLSRVKVIYDRLGASDQAAKGPDLLAEWKVTTDEQYSKTPAKRRGSKTKKTN